MYDAEELISIHVFGGNSLNADCKMSFEKCIINKNHFPPEANDEMNPGVNVLVGGLPHPTALSLRVLELPDSHPAILNCDHVIIKHDCRSPV